MANYPFISAKLHGKRRSLYEGDTLHRLCDTPGVQDLLRRFYPEREIPDHVALERALTEDHVRSLLRLLALLRGREKGLYLWLLRHYQLENLKLLFRCWSNQEPRAVANRYLAKLPKELDLPVDRLLGAADVPSFARAVPVLEWRRAFRGAEELMAEPGGAFRVQSALDRAYFESLRQALLALPSRHLESARPMVYFAIVIYDVLVMIRGRLAHNLPASALMDELVRAGYHLPDQRVRKILSATELTQVMPNLPRMLRSAAQVAADPYALERGLWEQLYRMADHAFYSGRFDVGTVVAYYYIKRTELANLIRVIEQIRAGVSPGEIRAQLVEVGREGG